LGVGEFVRKGFVPGSQVPVYDFAEAHNVNL